jgi:hypothetical protein
MTTFLLAVHVLAAIIAVGPVAVAAGMFPAAACRAATVKGGGLDNVSTVRLLYASAPSTRFSASPSPSSGSRQPT